jgi:hypothetical protein
VRPVRSVAIEGSVEADGVHDLLEERSLRRELVDVGVLPPLPFP